MKTLRLYLLALLALTAGACNRTSEKETETRRNLVYGIDADNYRLETAEVGKGETMSKILNSYGITVRQIDRLDRRLEGDLPPAQHPPRTQIHGLHPRRLALQPPPRLPGL